jgi:hypothetical protein
MRELQIPQIEKFIEQYGRKLKELFMTGLEKD